MLFSIFQNSADVSRVMSSHLDSVEYTKLIYQCTNCVSWNCSCIFFRRQCLRWLLSLNDLGLGRGTSRNVLWGAITLVKVNVGPGDYADVRIEKLDYHHNSRALSAKSLNHFWVLSEVCRACDVSPVVWKFETYLRNVDQNAAWYGKFVEILCCYADAAFIRYLIERNAMIAKCYACMELKWINLFEHMKVNNESIQECKIFQFPTNFEFRMQKLIYARGWLLECETIKHYPLFLISFNRFRCNMLRFPICANLRRKLNNWISSRSDDRKFMFSQPHQLRCRKVFPIKRQSFPKLFISFPQPFCSSTAKVRTKIEFTF